MQSGAKDQLARQFFRGVLVLGGLFTLVFSAEFLFEFWRHGWPDAEALSWGGVKNNKLVDALSPIARAYNNVLAMLIATIGLAIPLTANMHTPKLIDLFLNDRVNRVVLTLMAFGAANALWVIYIIGPGFAPMWAYRFAIYGALLGWVVIIPYFFYVVRFLDPSTIVVRIENEATKLLERAASDKINMEEAQDQIQERLFQIGTLVIKSIDRADRSVAREGIWSFKRVVDRYGQLKSNMPDQWFQVDRKDFVGMSHHALEMINQKQTWLERQISQQLLLSYQHALVKAPDAVSAISNVTRVLATLAAEREDAHAVSQFIRVFNTFLREALNRNDVRAAYDVFYQYRQLAGDLSDNHDVVCRIGSFFVTYGEFAESLGNRHVAKVAGFDLCHVMEKAYLAGNPKADEVLEQLLSLPDERNGELIEARVRIKLIAAGFFAHHQYEEQLETVRVSLNGVPNEMLKTEAAAVVSVEKRVFWEVTDRAINIEWTPEERRDDIERFAESLAQKRRGK